ncbi:MAG: hypothetical protein AAGF67_10195, partial [Verrucomicrobiota bacterium]
MKRFFVAAILLVGSLSLSFAEDEYRTFTNSSGKTIDAKVQSVQGAEVSILLKNGTPYTIQISSLSAEDQEYLKSWSAKPASPLPTTGTSADSINEVIGHPMFAGTTLWESDPGEVADRISWPRESKTEISESYRAYPREDYRFLGARPFSAALYGEDGKVTSISIVFANKGDSFRSAGSAEEHFIAGKPVPGGMEGVKVLMEHDSETISKSLTDRLGEPERQKFGEGEARVNAERWDWAGHSFLLSHVEGEYVSLSIQTNEAADDRGRTARGPDSVIRERARGFVERRENGDVVVTNVPMVDQGPKG